MSVFVFTLSVDTPNGINPIQLQDLIKESTATLGVPSKNILSVSTSLNEDEGSLEFDGNLDLSDNNKIQSILDNYVYDSEHGKIGIVTDGLITRPTVSVIPHRPTFGGKNYQAVGHMHAPSDSTIKSVGLATYCSKAGVDQIYRVYDLTHAKEIGSGTFSHKMLTPIIINITPTHPKEDTLVEVSLKTTVNFSKCVHIKSMWMDFE